LPNSSNITLSALVGHAPILDETSAGDVATSDQLASLRRRIAELELAEEQAAHRTSTAAEQLDAVRERRASLERSLVREREQRDRLIDEALSSTRSEESRLAAQVDAPTTTTVDRATWSRQGPQAFGDGPARTAAAGGGVAPGSTSGAEREDVGADETDRSAEAGAAVPDGDARQTRYERASAKLPSIGPEASKAAGSLRRLRKSARGA
jgi:hypothetical protein